MDSLIAARWQMGLSLAFHIVFAVIGMAMPVMMVGAEALWLHTKKDPYLELTKRWAKGTAIFFAVGAVSGTVLSFELARLRAPQATLILLLQALASALSSCSPRCCTCSASSARLRASKCCQFQSTSQGGPREVRHRT